MRTSRKEYRQLYMSVEGKNCETFYFEHLAKLINNSGRNTYNLNKKKSGKLFPYFHIQDIEDYYNPPLKKKFYKMLDEMDEAGKQFNIEYKLGYSNFSFELWMLLHTPEEINYAVTDRHAYLRLINKYFHREYMSMDDFKKEKEFKGILDEFVTLDSVFRALEKAKKIDCCSRSKDEYKGFRFNHDNPSTSVHEVVEMIFDICNIV